MTKPPTPKPSAAARELAEALFPFFNGLTTDGKKPRTQEAYEVSCVKLIDHALTEARRKAIEECMATIGEVLQSPDGTHKTIGEIIVRIRSLLPKTTGD
jgi:hypothetical protein